MDSGLSPTAAAKEAAVIAGCFGLKKKEETATQNDDTIYRVVTGSFRDKANAQERIAELKAAGFESFILLGKA